jgi:hypothetical protein
MAALVVLMVCLAAIVDVSFFVLIVCYAVAGTFEGESYLV